MLSVRHALYFKLAGSLVFLLVGLFFLVRRLSGEMGKPLPTPILAACAIAIVLGVLLLRFSSKRSQFRRSRRNHQAAIVAEVALMLGMILLGATISLPIAPGADGRTGFIAFWSMMLVSESSWWAWRQVHRRRTDQIRSHQAVRPAAHRDRLPNREIAEPPGEEFPKDVSQQITRGVCDGVEMVFGRLRGHFAPGEQHKNLHVAFCPPLAAAPHITVGAIEGPQATITVGESRNYGARFELRLAALPHQTCSVAIEFYAQPVD